MLPERRFEQMKIKELLKKRPLNQLRPEAKSQQDRRQRKRVIRYLGLSMLLIAVWLIQTIPSWSNWYATAVYPIISYVLSGFSNLFPFALGDLFIFLSLIFILFYPIYGALKRHNWRTIARREVEYLLWIYAWFYLAWGLNYSQKHFYERTTINYAPYTSENFKRFVDSYITRLNNAYTPVNSINPTLVQTECVDLYNQIADSLGINHPPHRHPKVKTMLFTPLISKVGVTGSMGPFFCEFTLNGHLLPSQYPATYAHELSHLLGITSEAEANFYAYQVCTRSSVSGIRFSGYFSVLGYVLGNASELLTEEEFKQVVNRIRPEIKVLYEQNRTYWMDKYSPIFGKLQDWIYDIYLKRNQIESGQKNYSEVVGLLISYQEWKLTLNSLKTQH